MANNNHIIKAGCSIGAIMASIRKRETADIVAQAAEEKVPETATEAELQNLKEQSLNARKDYDQAKQVQTTYHENLQGITRCSSF